MSILDSSAAAGSSALSPVTNAIKNPFSSTVQNNGERPADFPDGFEIYEYINGQQTGYLQLNGNMMPFIPFEWDSEQKISTEYYPGNKEAVVHLMGQRQGDLVIRGRFKDKRYKDPSFYGVSYQMCLALEAIAGRGNILKFGLEGPGGKWIRWGIMQKPSFKMNKLSWIDYEIKFMVISDEQPTNYFFADPEKQAPDSINFSLIAAAADFQSSYSAVPKTMPLSIAGAINNLISGVAANMNLVTNFVQTIISTGADIAASANRALGLIANARASISSMTRQIDSVEHSFTSMSVSGPPAQRAVSTMSNIAYIQEAQQGTFQLSQYLEAMQTQFEAIALTIPIARYRVKKSDTLQNISITFYGVSDYWTNIYDHNKLQSTQLIEGAILEIPHL
jgi:nucleoid-associated protein YgaU